MLNFRNVNIGFISLLVSGIGAFWLYNISFYYFIILFTAYSLILFYGCYYIGSNFFMRITCSATTDKKVISITFDDGPDPVNTLKILHILDAHQIQAAFFCIGKHIGQNEQLLKQVFDKGHIIGNHSYSHHFWFDLFTSTKMLTDMRLMDKEMKRVTGKSPILFRPPYGVMNPNLKKAIINGVYIPIGWSVRSMDTVIREEDKLLKKVAENIKPGAILLFHDTSAATTAILPAFIKQARSMGYEIIRLDKMLNLQAYA